MNTNIFQGVITHNGCKDYDRLYALLDKHNKHDKHELANIAFHQALQSGYGNDYELLAILIGKGADVNSYGPFEVPSASYHTPLAQAIMAENLGLVSFLVETGADVNQFIDHLHRGGWLPLHCVVGHRKNRIPIAKILLHYGADPHQSIEGKETPYELAVRLSRDARPDSVIHSIVEMMK